MTLLFTSGLATAQDDTDSPREFARVFFEDDEKILQTAIHTYVSPTEGRPKITLLGNLHYGTAEYFEAINEQLETADQVLFEAPGRPRFLSNLRQTDRIRGIRAKSAGQFLCAGLANYSKANEGAYPSSLEELMTDKTTEINKGFLQRAINQSGWDEPWNYTKTEAGFDLIGLGADKKEGGEDHAKDIVFNQDSEINQPLAAILRQTIESQRTELTRRLELVDQGEIIDYSDPKFVLCDLDEIQVKSYGMGGNGPSTMAGPPPGFFKGEMPEKGSDEFIQQREMYRNEFIKQCDPKNVPWMYGRGDLTGRAGEMYMLAVVTRNDIIYSDLKWILRQDKQPEHLVILYGAGHMPDLEKRLMKKFDYQYESTKWLTVVTSMKKAESKSNSDSESAPESKKK